MTSEKKEYCGLFGIFGDADAVQKTYFGLHSLQHRGQESTGIVCGNGRQLIASRHMGHVADVYTEEVLARLKGDNAIRPSIPRARWGWHITAT